MELPPIPGCHTLRTVAAAGIKGVIAFPVDCVGIGVAVATLGLMPGYGVGNMGYVDVSGRRAVFLYTGAAEHT
jgi:hypothetical protein